MLRVVVFLLDFGVNGLLFLIYISLVFGDIVGLEIYFCYIFYLNCIVSCFFLISYNEDDCNI